MFNKSKWIPLIMYNDSGKNFVVLCRRNFRSGMLYFKVKPMNRWGLSQTHDYPKLDCDEQFKKLMEMVKWKKI